MPQESPSSLLEVNPPASFISTIFHQDARVGTLKPDIVLVSTEGRLFYAHRDILHHTSVNQFCGLLLLEGIMCGNVGPCYALAEDSGTINVLLHTVYHLPFTTDVPPLQAVLQAVDALHKYGFPPKRFVAPYTPLFIFLLSQSPRSPMDVFLTATKYGLENLAVIVSSHLLAFPVSEITDEMASKMGAVYLRRLLLLLVSRAEYLRQLLFVLPKSHPRTLTCGFVEQKMLEKEWIVFAAELSGRVRPGMRLLYYCPSSILPTID